MEKEQAAAAESSSDEDGITADDLHQAVKKVRDKIGIIKMEHTLKSKRRARSKSVKLDEMTEKLKAKGIDVNETSLATRAKKRKTLGEHEDDLDAKAKAALGEFYDSDDDDEDLVSDEEVKQAERDKRGRKRTRDDSDEDMDDGAGKVKLGKRRRTADADIAMDSSDDEDETVPKGLRTSRSRRNMRMTPEQRKISAQKSLRDRSASRREGTKPQRLTYKPVPDDHIRLAKKINADFKHKIQRTEADREVNVKRPKHLYAGKMSNGTRDWR